MNDKVNRTDAVLLKIIPKEVVSLLHGDLPLSLLDLYGDEPLRHSYGDF